MVEVMYVHVHVMWTSNMQVFIAGEGLYCMYMQVKTEIKAFFAHLSHM